MDQRFKACPGNIGSCVSKSKIKRGLGTQLRGKALSCSVQTLNSVEAEREKEEDGKEQRDRRTETKERKPFCLQSSELLFF